MKYLVYILLQIIVFAFLITSSLGIMLFVMSIVGLFILTYKAQLVGLNKQFIVINYGVLFALFFLFSLLFWDRYDKMDVAAILLFFVITPYTVSNFLKANRNFIHYVNNVLFANFWFFSSFLILFGLANGINLDRELIFGIHKNGWAYLYEMLFIYIIYHNINSGKLKKGILIFVGFLSLLIAGSKTSIALVLFLFIGLLGTYAFYFALSILLVAVLYVFYNLVYDVTFLKTAVFRLQLWSKAIEEITKSWETIFFGNGPGTFVFDYNLPGVYLKENVHNYYLQYIYSYGILSFIVFFIYLIKLIPFRKMVLYPSVMVIVIFTLHSFFDVGWVKGQGYLASVFLGLVNYEVRIRNENLR